MLFDGLYLFGSLFYHHFTRSIKRKPAKFLSLTGSSNF
ncbi:hypothetical protein JCM19274_5499 [Algibacter lectus]|uniref:Uncharacterized protein n=1 Tax=Algibacter lectus TaxID=221126 RepID=A0A090WLA8_9FLAO|nr:hypothetical protein JCM19274_5499 [Algibacter lectus]